MLLQEKKFWSKLEALTSSCLTDSHTSSFHNTAGQGRDPALIAATFFMGDPDPLPDTDWNLETAIHSLLPAISDMHTHSVDFNTGTPFVVAEYQYRDSFKCSPQRKKERKQSRPVLANAPLVDGRSESGIPSAISPPRKFNTKYCV